MEKQLTKINSKTMNTLVEKLKSRGVDLDEHMDYLIEEKLISTGIRKFSSYQFLDKNDNPYRVNVCFVSKNKGVKIEYSENMTKFKEKVEELKKEYGELIEQEVSLNRTTSF